MFGFEYLLVCEIFVVFLSFLSSFFFFFFFGGGDANQNVIKNYMYMYTHC